MEIIKTEQEYNREFDTPEKVSAALEKALDIRKFEIDMYWKRATFFWSFVAAIFAGYFIMLKDGTLDNHIGVEVLITCVGVVFSWSWHLVNRGSKFWQINWEKHVDMLEDRITGPLYKTVYTNNNCFWQVHKDLQISVSKINQFLSLYVFLIWFILLLRGIFKVFNYVIPFSLGTQCIFLIVVTVVFLFFQYITSKAPKKCSGDAGIFIKKRKPLQRQLNRQDTCRQFE